MLLPEASRWFKSSSPLQFLLRLKSLIFFAYINNNKLPWRNRQTRRTQNPILRSAGSIPAGSIQTTSINVSGFFICKDTVVSQFTMFLLQI